jgi:hypothetical protein
MIKKKTQLVLFLDFHSHDEIIPFTSNMKLWGFGISLHDGVSDSVIFFLDLQLQSYDRLKMVLMFVDWLIFV